MKDVYLRILPVVLRGPACEVPTFALLDDGSSVTMLDAAMAKTLGLQGERKPLCIQWTGSRTHHDYASEVVSLEISAMDHGSRIVRLQNVRTAKSLNLPKQSIDMLTLKECFPYLSEVPFFSLRNAQPMILIGQEHVLHTVPRVALHGKDGEPVASKTSLGWVVHGAVCYPKRVDHALVHHNCDTINDHDNELNEMVKFSFSLESFGVQRAESNIKTADDIRAESILEATTRRVGPRFETGLLWRNDKVVFPDSKSMAMHRLVCMEKKIARDPQFASAYAAKIADYLSKGYAYKLTPEEARRAGPRTWYIPHFAVFNPNKPGKLRMVFDAAAKTNGTSLNGSLLKGPDLLNELPAVLFRFRQKRIGFIADIAEMFHQVAIRDEDLDSQRFLWRGENKNSPPDVYVMKSMIFGACCSPAAAIFVMHKNASEYKEEFPSVFEAITRCYYMDDYIDCEDTEESAINKIFDMIEVQRRGGFNLCNWMCSSKAVVNKIPCELRAKAWKELEVDAVLPTERVLGLWWNPEEDCFSFKLNVTKVKTGIADGTVTPTKRDVLRLISSIFDPLGFVAHFTVKARILFQRIWRSGIQWDEVLPGDLHETWRKWCSELPSLALVKVPRCYFPNIDRPSPQLHVFCDASSEAYSCVAYLRWECEGNVHVSFVCSRTRVSPLKPVTIPRLELMAAVLGSRLATKLKKEHDVAINSTIYWTDSKTVLHWVRSDPGRYKQFVANRLGEIQELTQVQEWRWVPTTDNVADDATRADPATVFHPQGRWYTGPPFLTQAEDRWPSEPTSLICAPETEEKTVAFVGFISPTTSTECILPDITRFSSWTRLIRTTAWVIRFLYNIRKKKFDRNPLRPFELLDAERMWWQKVQRECFSEEINRLMSTTPIQPGSRLSAFMPFLDENNILRVHGRVEYCNALPYSTKFPVILDSKHPFTRLLVNHYHLKAHHQGVETVISNLREKYWLTAMRSAIKSCFRNCQFCKIRRATPVLPIMAPLNPARVPSDFKVFAKTGVDMFGPFEVKVGRKKEKRYGMIFTCLAVRAVHIEVTQSLSTDAAIMAIQRFRNRRGHPTDIYSDNGSNFRGASKEVRIAWLGLDRERCKRELANVATTWHFLPPGAPHMGGAWERLIRSIKVALRAAISSRCPTEETFLTTMTEIEAVLNSRPLTYVSATPGDPKPLSPNDFLLFTARSAGAFGLEEQGRVVRRQWRQALQLADYFWSRWLKEYLPSLLGRNRMQQVSKPVRVGDIVVVYDSTSPRNSWPLGKVTQSYPGKDGHVRVVDVTTAFGTYRRPVSKIAVLDVHKDEED